MLTKLRHWFEPILLPPVIAQKRTKALQWVILLLAIFTLLVLPLQSLGFEITKSANLPAVIFLGLIYLGCWHLIRIGRIQLSSWIVCLLTFLTVTLLPQKTPNSLIVVYIFIVIISAVLLDSRAALVFFMMLTVTVPLYIFSDRRTIVINISEWQGYLLVFIAITPILLVVNRTLKKNFETIQQKNSEMIERNLELQALQSELEEQVSERIHRVNQALEQVREARQQVEDQLWFSTGQAQIDEVMQGEHSIESLAQSIIQEICQYLDITMGTIFIRSQDNFEWKASVTPQMLSTTQRQFELGEGLVGKVAHTQEPMLLLAPATYLSIPNDTQEDCYLFLQPIVYNQETMGILEFIQWHPISAQVQTLLQQISRNIGIAIHTTQAQTRIAQLTETKR